MSLKRWMAVDCALVLALAWWLVWPLFKARYLDRFDSIESTFIADGRFLKEHWPHPRWQPLWYGGTRFDYVYPPALRYGTALAAHIWAPAKAYHVYTAFFYGVGIAAVYLLIAAVSRSRRAAWAGAAASALVSPSFLFLREVRQDSGYLVPQRLWALVRYGEGPHMTALALVPVALACAWYGLRERSPLALAGAAVASAAVVSNNFYGATALAMLFPVMAWSVWLGTRDRRVWLRAAAIAALAYGLTAFWLTPSYVALTVRNMRYVSEPGNAWSAVAAAALAAGFGWASFRLARGRPERSYAVFLAGAVAALGISVLGNRYVGFRVMGEPGRLIPELDLVLILAAVELVRATWWRGWAWKGAAGAMAAAAVWSACLYLPHSRSIYTLHNDYRRRIEYRLTDWLAKNMPEARVMATGSVRFWFDAWHDLAQLGGGSEQGMQNPRVADAQWEVIVGTRPETAILWLTAAGVDAVGVHDARSEEVYHDWPNPAKFAGVLPVLWDSGAGDVLYRVPRRFPGLGRVVETRRLPPAVDTEGQLRAYVEAVESAPAGMRWYGTDAMDVHARVAPGQAVLVQTTYDPAWRAYAGGARLATRRDPMGFLLIETPPGEHNIRVIFELPLENAVGRVLTVLAAAALLGIAWRRGEKPKVG